MLITTNVSSFANAQINAYRGLAKKATETGETGSQDSGVVAALKRFFYKLDFLLKYGQFPSGEDTAPDALPKELRELKTFLENPHYEEKSYILQKDANTRYCFTRSDTDTSQITVTEERRYISPAGARTESWYQCEILPCEPNVLLVGLNLGQPVKTFTATARDVTKSFWNELNSFVEVNKGRHVNDFFSIKTEIINTNASKLVLRFSLKNDNAPGANIEYTFENAREMKNALSKACPYPPFTAIVSDGEKECTLLGHILEKAVKAGISLQGIDLRGANLMGANLAGADLTWACLTQVLMTGVHLEGANLEGANMARAYMDNAHLEGAYMAGANMERAYMARAYMARANMARANMARAQMTGAHMEDANMAGANMEDAGMWYAHMEGAHMEGANMKDASMWYAHLEGAHMEYAHMEDAHMEYAHMEDALRKYAHMQGAYLTLAQGG